MKRISIRYDESQVRKQYPRNQKPLQEVKSSGNLCIVSGLSVGVGDPRRIETVIEGEKIFFLRDKMIELLQTQKMPIPKGLHVSRELEPGKKFFDVEMYLQQIVQNVANKSLSESEEIISSVLKIADRFGINIGLSSIVSQNKHEA